MTRDEKDLNVVILKNADKDYKFKSISIQSFNDHYHKNVSNENNVYFIIPATPLSNIYMILDRKSMPKVFEPIEISYTLEVLAMDPLIKYEMETVYQQKIVHKIIRPHDLFTFIYNLSELTLFNTIFNDDRNNVGSDKRAYVFNVFSYQISSYGTTVESEAITGIPSLINALCTRYNMVLSSTNPIECFLNADGSSYYSDPSELFSASIPKMLGYMKNPKSGVMSLPLQYVQVPVYTFISERDARMIETVDEYYYRGNGVVGYFMGNAYKMKQQLETLNTSAEVSNDIISELIYPTKTSIVHISSLIDFVIYLKLAPSMMRVADTLTKIKIHDKFDDNIMEDITPCFRYEFFIIPEHSDNNKRERYHEDYLMKDIAEKDPYDDFIKDVEAAWIPF